MIYTTGYYGHQPEALKSLAADIGMHFSYVSDILNYESRYRESIALIERAMEGK